MRAHDQCPEDGETVSQRDRMLRYQQWLKQHRTALGVTACTVLLLVHMIVPPAGIDIITVYLLLVGIVLLFGPELARLLERIRRLEWNGKAIELEAARVNEELAAVRSRAKRRPAAEKEDERASVLEKLISETRDDPRAAFMILSARLEGLIRDTADKSDVGASDRFASPRQLMIALEKAGHIRADVAQVFGHFWNVRNEVVHGVGQRVSEQILWSLIETGLQLEELLLAVGDRPETRSESS